MTLLSFTPGTVFPAYAGVFLQERDSAELVSGLPRIRGGVSDPPSPLRPGCWSSPHTRGCFCSGAVPRARNRVFPAYAGVFLTGQISISAIRRLPRIRGGVSYVKTLADRIGKSSPHTRGCFYLRVEAGGGIKVFPAYAGVFLKGRPEPPRAVSLPRIRGGVSSEG